MSTAKFRRSLSDKALHLLQQNPTAQAILESAASDPELSVQLRGSKVDVYYEGYIVFRIGAGDMTRSCGIRNQKESAAYLPI